jgi:hypothetical protein
MPLKLGGLAGWFVARKLHGVRLSAFTHFLEKASRTYCVGQSDLEHSVQSLAYAQCLLGEFIGVLQQ